MPTDLRINIFGTDEAPWRNIDLIRSYDVSAFVQPIKVHVVTDVESFNRVSPDGQECLFTDESPRYRQELLLGRYF
jgi:hypothetical protein